MLLKRLLLFAVIFVASAACFAQTLLFGTGFESNTSLSSINFGMDGAGHWLTFSGTALSGTDFYGNTGSFSWATPPYTANYWGLRLETVSISGTPSATGYFVDNIDTTASDCHSGNQCLHMVIENIPSGSCCAQVPGPGESGITQPIREFYERFWMKLSSAEQTAAQNYGGYWADHVIYFKTPDDYRIEPDVHLTYNTETNLRDYLISDAGGVSATCPVRDPITAQTFYYQGGTPATNSSCSYTYAAGEDQGISVPWNTWFEVEFYFKRSPNPDGRIAYAINQKVAADYTGITMGPDGEDITDFGFMQQYGWAYPLEKWIDDWEIWSTIPCTTFPCGTVTGSGGGASTISPSINSYPAAVGAVGTPFSYQIVANGSPTNYQLYSGSLPSGLSLNTSTGVISGTPTATFSCQGPGCPRFTANSSEGQAAQWIEFQINSSVQTPVIEYFSCNPCTAPATLKWITLGAGTVALSINNGVGSVSGPNGSVTVNPTTNTTYTLTATNSAGSTSTFVTGGAATATVTVGSGNAPSPPSALAATVQ